MDQTNTKVACNKVNILNLVMKVRKPILLHFLSQDKANSQPIIQTTNMIIY